MVNQVSTTQIEDEFQRAGNEVTERSAGADIQPPTREQLQGRAPGSPQGPDLASMESWGNKYNNFVNREYFSHELSKQQIAESARPVEQSTSAQEAQQQPQSRSAEAAPAQDMPLPQMAAGLTQQQTSQALGVSQVQGATAEATLAGYMASSGGGKEQGGVTQGDRNLEAYFAGADAKERQAEGNGQRAPSQHDNALEAHIHDPSAGKSQDVDRSDRNMAAQYDAAQANDNNAAQRGHELDL